VADACAGQAMCQVLFGVGKAPSGFPLTDAQMESKVAQWQQNMNSGLRRWMVDCKKYDLFANGRSCF
jgi:hypothetical protein